MIQRLKAGNEAGSGEMKRNEAGTGHQISAQTAREGSRPVRYEIIDKNGRYWDGFHSAASAVEWATACWPDQQRDKDWFVQTEGSDPAERGPVQVVGGE